MNKDDLLKMFEFDKPAAAAKADGTASGSPTAGETGETGEGRCRRHRERRARWTSGALAAAAT